jgi:hypothetical protein
MDKIKPSQITCVSTLQQTHATFFPVDANRARFLALLVANRIASDQQAAAPAWIADHRVAHDQERAGRYLKSDTRPSLFLPSLFFGQQQGLYDVPGRSAIAH